MDQSHISSGCGSYFILFLLYVKHVIKWANESVSNDSVQFSFSSLTVLFNTTNVLSSDKRHTLNMFCCDTHPSSVSTYMTNFCNDNVIHYQVVSHSIIVWDNNWPCTFIYIHYRLQTRIQSEPANELNWAELTWFETHLI